MAIFKEIRSESLIRELQRELNTDVLLFGFDGMVYFGNLQRIEDCRVAYLSPAIEAESNVEILSPGGELVDVRFLHVDLWQIVAKATGVRTDPFDNGGRVPFQGAPNGSPDPSAPIEVAIRTDTTARQESHELICTLKRMIGDDVVITTLGGFLFEGRLGEVDDELAFLSIEEILGPATSSGISSDDVTNAVVNLEAITSVSSSADS